MTLPEYYDTICALPDGGYLNPDTRFDKGYMYNLIHAARATVIRMDYIKNKKPRPIWYQSYTPPYSRDFQDGQLLCVKFQLPDVIALSGAENGYGYVGTIQCNKAYRIWTSRADFAAACTDRLMNPSSGRTVNVLFEGSNYGEIYGPALMDIPRFVAIYSDPTKVPTYNILKDQYPFEESNIKDMCNVITRTDMTVITKSFVDRVQQGRIDNAQPIPQRS